MAIGAKAVVGAVNASVVVTGAGVGEQVVVAAGADNGRVMMGDKLRTIVADDGQTVVGAEDKDRTEFGVEVGSPLVAFGPLPVGACGVVDLVRPIVALIKVLNALRNPAAVCCALDSALPEIVDSSRTLSWVDCATLVEMRGPVLTTVRTGVQLSAATVGAKTPPLPLRLKLLRVPVRDLFVAGFH